MSNAGWEWQQDLLDRERYESEVDNAWLECTANSQEQQAWIEFNKGDSHAV